MNPAGIVIEGIEGVAMKARLLPCHLRVEAGASRKGRARMVRFTGKGHSAAVSVPMGGRWQFRTAICAAPADSLSR